MDTYSEKQYFAGWVYLLMIGIGIGTVASIPFLPGKMSTGGADFAVYLVAVPTVLLSLFFVLNLLRMETVVSDKEVYVRFGIIFTVLWKHIPMVSIETVAAVSYRPLRDAGGWGYRYGKYAGQLCWYYNASGSRGVLLMTQDDRRFVLGSQEPEHLAAAIVARMTGVSGGRAS